MTTAAPKLYARLDHESGNDHLLVCFNSYGSPARGIDTPLENFGWLTKLGVSTLWFAEAGPRGWYTGFDREINAWIVHAVEQHGLKRVTLLGSSCGAYASIRHAQLLTGTLAPSNGPLDVRAIAINPQTGFDDALLNGIRGGLRQAGWAVDELGSNPVLPLHEDLCAPADAIPISDLRRLGEAMGTRAEAPSIAILFDARNPIDFGFATHLDGLPGVSLHPESLGLHHADGARWFWKSASFREQVEQRTAPRDPAAEIGDALNAERARWLQQFAATRWA
jgi:hypothetical protein